MTIIDNMVHGVTRWQLLIGTRPGCYNFDGADIRSQTRLQPQFLCATFATDLRANRRLSPTTEEDEFPRPSELPRPDGETLGIVRVYRSQRTGSIQMERDMPAIGYAPALHICH